MPSREELITIIERNEPAIFRGAALNWKMRQVRRRDGQQFKIMRLIMSMILLANLDLATRTFSEEVWAHHCRNRGNPLRLVVRCWCSSPKDANVRVSRPPSRCNKSEGRLSFITVCCPQYQLCSHLAYGRKYQPARCTDVLVHIRLHQQQPRGSWITKYSSRRLITNSIESLPSHRPRCVLYSCGRTFKSYSSCLETQTIPV